jgi:hypothetical protein
MGAKALPLKLAFGGRVIGDHIVSDPLCPVLGTFLQSDTIRSRQGQRLLKTGPGRLSNVSGRGRTIQDDSTERVPCPVLPEAGDCFRETIQYALTRNGYRSPSGGLGRLIGFLAVDGNADGLD